MKAGKSKKLTIQWEGPYEVKEIRPPVNVVIKKGKRKKKTQTASVDRLKPYHARSHEDVSSQPRGECYDPLTNRKWVFDAVEIPMRGSAGQTTTSVPMT